VRVDAVKRAMVPSRAPAVKTQRSWVTEMYCSLRRVAVAEVLHAAIMLRAASPATVVLWTPTVDDSFVRATKAERDTRAGSRSRIRHRVGMADSTICQSRRLS
jgi:hypothetical protein